VQTARVGAIVIVDNPFGRQLAEQYALEYHGTPRVLERLHLLGLLTPGMLRGCLKQLLSRRIRLPVGSANELLQRIGEAKL
jgi:predicted nucleic acid-binding protein